MFQVLGPSALCASPTSQASWFFRTRCQGFPHLFHAISWGPAESPAQARLLPAALLAAPPTAAVGNGLQQGSARLFLGYPGPLGETLYPLLTWKLSKSCHLLFGYATTVIPRVYTYYVSTALFAIFGIRMLREGLKMSPDEGQEELEEVQAELKKKDEEFQRTKLLNGPGDVETGASTTIPQKRWLHFISPIFVQALTLTFLAEWGDRSQLTTIVLAAREDPYGVAVGGTVGHCLCTGLAVIGGRMIAQKISVRTVTIIGGIVFLAFAFSALFISPDSGF
ncbi:transmembrane protein 165 isoform X2 [Mirounga leonina]|uniref:transmembrane protein 165 isoform X2 n=1 Tax=Mirounga leonina TaxID=9715 RepID=UPI00156BEB5E|nr:transmembrane protein 165 isoform X2 [Mirounga leonina]